MEERHIYEGKTSTEAIEKGLKDLGLKKSDVEVISVEDEEKREMSEEAINKAKQNLGDFLNVFLKQISDEELTYNIEDDKYYIYVNIEGEKTNSLIGYRGENLNALQTLLGAISNKNIEEKTRVILDISGYREKRKKVLEELAEKVSKTVIKTRKKVTLEPMSAYERKIIHSKLQNHPKVTTESVGEEPNRKIVVLLKK